MPRKNWSSLSPRLAKCSILLSEGMFHSNFSANFRCYERYHGCLATFDSLAFLPGGLSQGLRQFTRSARKQDLDRALVAAIVSKQVWHHSEGFRFWKLNLLQEARFITFTNIDSCFVKLGRIWDHSKLLSIVIAWSGWIVKTGQTSFFFNLHSNLQFWLPMICNCWQLIFECRFSQSCILPMVMSSTIWYVGPVVIYILSLVWKNLGLNPGAHFASLWKCLGDGMSPIKTASAKLLNAQVKQRRPGRCRVWQTPVWAGAWSDFKCLLWRCYVDMWLQRQKKKYIYKLNKILNRSLLNRTGRIGLSKNQLHT